jgi:acetyl-CoA C-acetyltransferase
MGCLIVNKQLSEMYHPYTMGETAENVAKWNVSRGKLRMNLRQLEIRRNIVQNKSGKFKRNY